MGPSAERLDGMRDNESGGLIAPGSFASRKLTDPSMFLSLECLMLMMIGAAIPGQRARRNA